MATNGQPVGRAAVASRSAPRIKQTTCYELHYLRRAKLLMPGGAPVHHGIGVFDTQTGTYVQIFHSNDVLGEHDTDFVTFAGGLRVERVLVDPVEGAWERLAVCRAKPLPWAADHNCQHTATWIFLGFEDSHTFESIKVGSGTLLVVGVLAALVAG